jgi:hypothetical protein
MCFSFTIHHLYRILKVNKTLHVSEMSIDWELCGTVCCDTDDANTAVQGQLALIFEHAEVVSPSFKIMRKSLEAGWKPAADETGKVMEEGGEGASKPAPLDQTEVVPLVRKQIPQGTVKAGFRNLVPIQVSPKKVVAK